MSILMRPGAKRPNLTAALTLGMLIGMIACSPAGRDEPGPTVKPAIPEPSATGISGYLFQDRDGNGLHGVGERVLTDWPVRVYSTGPLPLIETRSDSQGVFSIPVVENVTPGESSVHVRTVPVMEGPAETAFPNPSALSQSFIAPLGQALTVPVTSFSQCLAPDQCPGLDLPDLTPQLDTDGGADFPPSTQTRVDSTTIPRTVLLRFATSTANLGGLLHITAVPVGSGQSEQSVQQRIYGAGVVLIRDAGSFIYHPEHHHFHVGEFIRYELLAQDRTTVLRTSEKVSFCLTDVLEVDPPERVDGTVFLDLKPFDCGTTEQGINPGFADYYGAELPDQWIDVTGLPSGKFWVRLSVDPEGQFLESDRTNNTASFEVDYVAPE